VAVPLWLAAGVSVNVQLPAAGQLEAPVIPALGSSGVFELVAVTVSTPVPVSVKFSVPLCPAATVTFVSPETVGAALTVKLKVPVALCPLVSATVTVTVAVPVWLAAGVRFRVQLPAAVQLPAPVMLALGSSGVFELVAVSVSVPVPASVKLSVPLVPVATVRLVSPEIMGPEVTVKPKVPVAFCPLASVTWTVTVALPVWLAAGARLRVQLPAAVQLEAPVIPALGSSVAFELVAVSVSVPVPASVKLSVPLCPVATVTFVSPEIVGAALTVKLKVPVALCP